MTTNDPVLSVRGLHKRFVLHGIGGREVVALHGVDLDVCSGEHVAVVGPSGAGKSSLLKCVYRTYRPSAGEVRLGTAEGVVDLAALPDHEMADLREREIGYVSQFLRPEPRRGAREIVARAGMCRGLELDDARELAAAILTRLVVDRELWETHPALLSGGEQQRVNLAAATLSPPGLLLLDEPVAALDPATRRVAIDLIAELTRRDVAVLSVLHEPDVVERLADRCLLLRGGRPSATGTPREVFAGAFG